MSFRTLTRTFATSMTVVVALLLPCDVGAQSTGRLYRVGYLGAGATSVMPAALDAFRDELKRRGYVEGRNLLIEYRWAGGADERLRGLADEMVRAKVDVIVVEGHTPAIQAAKEATNQIPIVMAVSGDPVGSGLVASLAKPGGNITGLTILSPELAGKRLEL